MTSLRSIDLTQYATVAAADSGYDLAVGLGLKVHLLLGDMDSITASHIPDDVEVMSYPQDKDYSDTVLGLKTLADRGISDVLVLGGGEGRLDHLLSLCREFSKASAVIHWITRLEHIWVLNKETLELKGLEDTRISIFPEPGVTVNATGLLWSTRDVAYSLSNRMTGSTCTISVQGGSALVMMDISGYLGQRIQ